MYFFLFSKLWSVLNESIPEAVICISDLFISRVWTHAFSTFSVFKQRYNLCLSKLRGLCTKLVVLDFRSWCRTDSPDTQIRNSCSMIWLPSSLQTILYIWCMLGSWGMVHVHLHLGYSNGFLPWLAYRHWGRLWSCSVGTAREQQLEPQGSVRVFIIRYTESKDVGSSR